MKIGKVEIDELTISMILLFMLLISGLIMAGKSDIEKEKTKQFKVELEIEQQKNAKGSV